MKRRDGRLQPSAGSEYPHSAKVVFDYQEDFDSFVEQLEAFEHDACMYFSEDEDHYIDKSAIGIVFLFDDIDVNGYELTVTGTLVHNGVWLHTEAEVSYIREYKLVSKKNLALHILEKPKLL